MKIKKKIYLIGPGGLCAPPVEANGRVAGHCFFFFFFIFLYFSMCISFHPLWGYPGSLFFGALKI